MFSCVLFMIVPVIVSSLTKSIRMIFSTSKNSIKQLYESDIRPVFSLFISGGGVTSLEWLLTTPGGSRCIMNAEIPYSRSALSNRLNQPNEEFKCDENSVRVMAFEAYKDATKNFLFETKTFQSLIDINIFGIACTAALVSETVKKGDHRVFISTYDSKQTHRVYKCILEKGLRDRNGEDNKVSEFIMNILHLQCKATSPILVASNVSMSSAADSVEGFSPVDSDVSDNFYTLKESVLVEDSGALKPEVLYSKELMPVGDSLDRLYNQEISHIIYIPSHLKSSNEHSFITIVNVSQEGSSAQHLFASFEDLQLPPGAYDVLLHTLYMITYISLREITFDIYPHVI